MEGGGRGKKARGTEEEDRYNMEEGLDPKVELLKQIWELLLTLASEWTMEPLTALNSLKLRKEWQDNKMCSRTATPRV